MTPLIPESLLAEIEAKARKAQEVGSDFTWFSITDLTKNDRFDERDAEFIAAVNPETTLKLIAELKWARAMLGEAKGLIKISQSEFAQAWLASSPQANPKGEGDE